MGEQIEDGARTIDNGIEVVGVKLLERSQILKTFSYRRYWSPGIVDKVKALIREREPSFVIVEQEYMSQYY
ncbi:MAG: hypothetical protein OXT08_04830, partial [Candidatus Marinimicrobia bacterium]|nr:hypothetical protein [Candidatus Neomarinimicrobiota bacterium]